MRDDVNRSLDARHLAALVGADLGVMARDARRMRGDGPFVFAQVMHGVGVADIAAEVIGVWRKALEPR